MRVVEKGVPGCDVFDVLLTNRSHAFHHTHNLNCTRRVLILFYSKPRCPSKRVDRHLCQLSHKKEPSFLSPSWLVNRFKQVYFLRRAIQSLPLVHRKAGPTSTTLHNIDCNGLKAFDLTVKAELQTRIPS